VVWIQQNKYRKITFDIIFSVNLHETILLLIVKLKIKTGNLTAASLNGVFCFRIPHQICICIYILFFNRFVQLYIENMYALIIKLAFRQHALRNALTQTLARMYVRQIPDSIPVSAIHMTLCAWAQFAAHVNAIDKAGQLPDLAANSLDEPKRDEYIYIYTAHAARTKKGCALRRPVFHSPESTERERQIRE
jgi:hypothetical protein